MKRTKTSKKPSKSTKVVSNPLGNVEKTVSFHDFMAKLLTVKPKNK